MCLFKLLHTDIEQHIGRVIIPVVWWHSFDIASPILFSVIKTQWKQVRGSSFLSQHKDQGGKQFKCYFAEGHFLMF